MEAHSDTVETQSTVQDIFCCVDCLAVRWGALHFGPSTDILQLNDHPVFILFVRESSLGEMDPALMWRVDFRGFSDASQATIRALEVKDRAWTFEAELDVAQHPDLINNSSGDISSEYFETDV